MATETAELTLRQALRQYLDARNAAMVAARAALGISDIDARALLFVVDNPGTRPTALREYLGITSAGVTTLIDRLVDRSLVRRDVDPDDRRVNRITATIDIAEDPWSVLSRFDDDFDIAVAAADKASLGAGRRMRIHDLRGSSALAYESDIVLILSEKVDIVARDHLIYDLGNAQRFSDWCVVTVEKNRHGRAGVELEFHKDFTHGRFHTDGQEVKERLIDERVFVN